MPVGFFPSSCLLSVPIDQACGNIPPPVLPLSGSCCQAAAALNNFPASPHLLGTNLYHLPTVNLQGFVGCEGQLIIRLGHRNM